MCLRVETFLRDMAVKQLHCSGLFDSLAKSINLCLFVMYQLDWCTEADYIVLFIVVVIVTIVALV